MICEAGVLWMELQAYKYLLRGGGGVGFWGGPPVLWKAGLIPSLSLLDMLPHGCFKPLLWGKGRHSISLIKGDFCLGKWGGGHCDASPQYQWLALVCLLPPSLQLPFVWLCHAGALTVHCLNFPDSVCMVLKIGPFLYTLLPVARNGTEDTEVV